MVAEKFHREASCEQLLSGSHHHDEKQIYASAASCVFCYYTDMKTKLLVTLVFFAGLCAFGATAAQGRFLHPGIGLNREQLDQLKANVQGGVEPWKTLYGSLTKHDHRFRRPQWLHPRDVPPRDDERADVMERSS